MLIEMEGFEGREPGSLWQLVSSLNRLYSLRYLLCVALGSQSMKWNVLLSQISLDHKENNKATVIEEKKKQSREKMTGSPEAKCMTDANGVHHFSAGKFQQLPQLSPHLKCFTTQMYLINHFQATHENSSSVDTVPHFSLLLKNTNNTLSPNKTLSFAFKFLCNMVPTHVNAYFLVFLIFNIIKIND